MTILIYIHLLFRTYSAIVKDALEWNKKFWKPIKFSYSWLQGVVISVQVESACVGNEGARGKEKVAGVRNDEQKIVNEKQKRDENDKKF